MYQQEIKSLGVNGNHIPGVASGLITQQDFESGNLGHVYVDLSRKVNAEDDLVPRTVEVLGNNSSLAMVDVKVFLFYENSFGIDVGSSQLTL